MNILGMKSTGDQTSVSVMLGDEINSFLVSHERKDRPNWEFLLSNIGHKKNFNLYEIDLFAFADCQNSYTATRLIASYLKGLATALGKPLIVVKDLNNNNFEADSVVKNAKEIFLKNTKDNQLFDPQNANPSYSQDTKFQKINE